MSTQPKPTKSHAGLPPFSKEYLANEHDAKTFGQPKPTAGYKHTTHFEQQYTQPKPATDQFKCQKCGAVLGWCEPFLCDKCQPKPTTGEQSVFHETSMIDKSAERKPTTSEWTVERLSNYRDPLALANDINDAIAAEREQKELTVKMYLKASDERDQLREQLAAERHNVEILTRENDGRDQREAEYAQKMVAEIQARDKLLADALARIEKERK